jgi:hypothetical protein
VTTASDSSRSDRDKAAGAARGSKPYFFPRFAFSHRARLAFLAISRLCSALSAAARAFPPFFAPSLDKATAWGFLSFAINRMALMPEWIKKGNWGLDIHARASISLHEQAYEQKGYFDDTPVGSD